MKKLLKIREKIYKVKKIFYIENLDEFMPNNLIDLGKNKKYISIPISVVSEKTQMSCIEFMNKF